MYSLECAPGDSRKEAAFHGDFYRDPANVYRGVNLMEFMEDDHALGEPPHAKGCGEGPGFHYREPDEGLKGTSIGAAGFPDDHFFAAGDRYRTDGPITRGVSLQAPFFQEADEVLGRMAPSCKEQPPELEDAFFKPGDEPPPLPTSKFFKLSPSNMKVATDAPGELGNVLLRFLRAECTSDIMKPAVGVIPKATKTKYSIKAIVFVQAEACTLKIKVYREAPTPGKQNAYLVDVQRRSGDSIVFYSVFAKAVKYIGDLETFSVKCPDCLPQFKDYDDGVVVASSAQEANIVPDGCRLQLDPLLDMAGASGAPLIQAEGASALAGLARDRRNAASLCNQEVFDTLGKLLSEEDITIAYPTALTLRLLAENAELDSLSYVGERKESLTKKARTTQSSLVRRELDRVVELCAP